MATSAKGEVGLPDIGILRKHLDLIEESSISKQELQGLHETGIFSVFLRCRNPRGVNLEELKRVLLILSQPSPLFEFSPCLPFYMRYGAIEDLKRDMTFYPPIRSDEKDRLASRRRGEIRLRIRIAHLSRTLSVAQAEKELKKLGTRLPDPEELLALFKSDQMGDISSLPNLALGTHRHSGVRVTTLLNRRKEVRWHWNGSPPLSPGHYFVIDLQ